MTRFLPDAVRGTHPLPVVVLLLFGLTALSASPATAQRVVDVSGPGQGETTYLMQSPRTLADNVMVRALGVRDPDGGARYALMIRNVGEDEAVTLMANNTPVEVERTDVTTQTPRTLSVYVSGANFLAMAEAGSATVTIGGNRYPLPKEVKASLSEIYDRTQ
jgi:hypothetical protein